MKNMRGTFQLSFGKKVDGELKGWNIRYKDLEPIMLAVNEIAEPF